ncbi:Mediator of RNA polymerase II transcription subunit 7 [Lecanosticta acicola]|uniref:Mediator of RNA polymerase II transcription subunit 7 n=1 Tax=Lecanosticta acicola TaxID=111012 RepID=A0AAI8Z4G3_9PEZI|nr:Mediator of RNA polymerase II transcription subunit 7 [Lecanosticta acicola]
MATEQTGPAAAFPTPPPFYHHFTKQNLARIRQIRREAGASATSDGQDESNRDIHVLSLPTELRYLIPPEPPGDNANYMSFGNDMTRNATDPTLADSKIEQLYPSDPSVRLNPQPYLLALARSMLTTFLSLTGILSENPELQEMKSLDLQAIVFNMHDLINQYRPHQARETLILMMEERVEQMRKEIRAVDEGQKKVQKLLQDLQTNGQAQALQEDDAGREKIGQDLDAKKRRARQSAAWAALEAEMG